MHSAHIMLAIAATATGLSTYTAGVDEPYTHQRDTGSGTKPEGKKWADIIGSKVAAEGIAWGATEKGWGAYVILESARVYVDGLDLLKAKAEGKLIRVTGILAAKRIPAARPGAAGPSREIVIYTIETAQWKLIDRVEWPWLEAL
jgi:hypothetical protein